VLPIVHGLEKEYGERIDFVRVNIHNPENAALMEKYGFTSSPELYLVVDGEVVGAWDGFASAEELREAFEAVLK